MCFCPRPAPGPTVTMRGSEVDSAIVNIQANILKGVQVATVNIPGPLMVVSGWDGDHMSWRIKALNSWFCKVKNLGACKIPLAAHKKSETFHPAPPSSSALSTTIASPVPATVPCPSTSFDSNGLSSDILGNIKAIVGSDNGGNICSASFGLCKIVRIRWIELFQSFKISRCCQRLGINVCLADGTTGKDERRLTRSHFFCVDVERVTVVAVRAGNGASRSEPELEGNGGQKWSEGRERGWERNTKLR
ncbi:hypothetical protein B0H14DRAFT_2599990 [Mycena olivaceomarginata]|nr:hypothetical protein B0H14DRAFT_2599990 [Mycena olivaceomarginata]